MRLEVEFQKFLHARRAGGVAIVLATAMSIATAQAQGKSSPLLTRSSCWAFTNTYGKTTFCFFNNARVTMKKTTKTADDKGVSTCDFSGTYSLHGAKVTITFQPNSGKCSNGASAPEWTAVCDSSDESLACLGSTIVDGKTYDVNFTAN